MIRCPAPIAPEGGVIRSEIRMRNIIILSLFIVISACDMATDAVHKAVDDNCKHGERACVDQCPKDADGNECRLDCRSGYDACKARKSQ